MTGAKWDFNGDGSWDREVNQGNFSSAHTYPTSSNYNVKLQLNMSDGEVTPVCSQTVSVPMGTIVKLTGQIYSDNNCNNFQEPDEQGIGGVTVNVFRVPDYSLYATLTTDSDGYYNLTKVISNNDSLSIQASDIAASGFKINANRPSFALSSNQPYINQNLAQVPNGNIGLCI